MEGDTRVSQVPIEGTAEEHTEWLTATRVTRNASAAATSAAELVGHVVHVKVPLQRAPRVGRHCWQLGHDLYFAGAADSIVRVVLTDGVASTQGTTFALNLKKGSVQKLLVRVSSSEGSVDKGTTCVPRLATVTVNVEAVDVAGNSIVNPSRPPTLKPGKGLELHGLGHPRLVAKESFDYSFAPSTRRAPTDATIKVALGGLTEYGRCASCRFIL